MRFEGGERALRGLVRHEPQIKFRDCLVGQNRLSARASVAADDSLNVDRGRVRPSAGAIPSS